MMSFLCHFRTVIQVSLSIYIQLYCVPIVRRWFICFTKLRQRFQVDSLFVMGNIRDKTQRFNVHATFFKKESLPMYTISIQIVKGKKLFECRLSIISMLQKFRMSFSKKLFGQDQAHVCLFSPTIYFCLVLLNLNFSKTTHEKNPMI